MASQATTAAPSETSEPQLEPIKSTKSNRLHKVESPEERAAKLELAQQEGHDADIPSNIGYVLSEEGERKRRQSITLRKSEAGNRPSLAKDVEKTAPGAGDQDVSESTTDDENDPDVVWWDGPDDPENPMNWPAWRKMVNCGLISAITFVTPLASSMFAPGVPEVMVDFESSSNTLASFVVSVYVLGFAAGPMLFAPLSEIYGRTIVYHISNVGFVAFLLGSALAPTMNSLIAFRFLSGLFGSTPLTNGGGSIADMIPQDRRAAWMAVFSLGPLMGPIVGPVVGGFVSGGPGWRWCFWILTITAGVIAIAMLIFLKETYAPVILERKAERKRKETGNSAIRSKLDVGLSPADYFKKGIVRPFVMLAKSPICLIFSLYIAVVYGYLYLMFTSITSIFLQTYGFSTSTVGLTFLGLGIGSLLGLAYYSITSDKYMKKRFKEDNDRLAAEGKELLENPKPEYRLPPLMLGAPLLPIGLFIYGWTAEYGVHWIVPILGTCIVGAGNLVIFMALQLYLVDAFHMYAASALAGNTVVRSIAGGVLPLAGLPLFDSLGVGWGNSVLGFIATAMLPAPFFILKYGERMRMKFEFKDL
ncbi:bicyclomycin resistance [Zalerion maritima]|uniref:Bicyclomycin resistance n=1 Tax=Zalerion maritima TaxID=339359 RepID=A0AAD5WPX2_9PEZI|nr:bicyclomycin resistance [Zalerion maritima]